MAFLLSFVISYKGTWGLLTRPNQLFISGTLLWQTCVASLVSSLPVISNSLNARLSDDNSWFTVNSPELLFARHGTIRLDWKSFRPVFIFTLTRLSYTAFSLYHGARFKNEKYYVSHLSPDSNDFLAGQNDFSPGVGRIYFGANRPVVPQFCPRSVNLYFVWFSLVYSSISRKTVILVSKVRDLYEEN